MAENKELTETIVALTIFLIFGGLLTLTAGLTGHGFESTEFKSIFAFYAPILAFSLLGIFLLRIGAQNTPGKFFAFIHDPDKGVFEKTSFIENPWTLFVISLVIFTLLGLANALSNTFFVATPQAWAVPAQQISQTSQLLFGIEPAASTETALFILMIFLAITLLKNTLLKNIDFNKNKGAYIAMSVILSILVGLLWGSYHSIRYGNQEASFLFTVAFGFIGTILTLFTGSIIPWYVWHFCNNLFYQANLMFSDDRIIVFTVLGLVIIVIPILLISIFKRKKKNAT